jgi:hypothetical protein
LENRYITAALGCLFVGLAIAIVIFADRGWPAYLAAVAVGALGVDAIHGAVRGRRCLLSRIGPLP